jgi:hypothetical protein
MTSQPKSNFVTVVSGLPRSGTSMMMRMLKAGGMPLLTDEERRPDADNPHGYYEFEPVKKLKSDASWLKDAGGKAVKAIYLLLYDLPEEFTYRIVFLRRSIVEVITSQDKMLSRSSAPTGSMDKQILVRHFETHLKQIDAWLRRQPNMAVLYVNYGIAVSNPQNTATRVAEFLGGTLDAAKMAATIDPDLYRQRADDDSRI